jgi:hypothetical protein
MKELVKKEKLEGVHFGANQNLPLEIHSLSPQYRTLSPNSIKTTIKT